MGLSTTAEKLETSNFTDATPELAYEGTVLHNFLAGGSDTVYISFAFLAIPTSNRTDEKISLTFRFSELDKCHTFKNF